MNKHDEKLMNLHMFKRNLEQILSINEFCTFDNDLLEIKYKFKNIKTGEVVEVNMNLIEMKENLCG